MTQSIPKAETLAEVTQADRELFNSLFRIPAHRRAEVLAGTQDETAEMQEIAAHRIAERERCAGIAELYQSLNCKCNQCGIVRGIATAIREQSA